MKRQRLFILVFFLGLQALPGPAAVTSSITTNHIISGDKKMMTEPERKADEMKVREWVKAARSLRTRFQADCYRPAYHFVMPEGTAHAFDPNGAIYWKGRYHLMYIYQDYDRPGKDCWGHASSIDLLHWRIHPPALSSDSNEDQIYSGGAFVNKEGRPTIIYHGVKEGKPLGNCIAIARDDDLIEWAKLPENPVVLSPKEGDPNRGKYWTWDPTAWLEDDTYYAIFGGWPKPTLFKSKDLKNWEYRGRLIEDMALIQGGDVSCPDFFPLGDRHVLTFISHNLGLQYVIGRWENELFKPEAHGMMNWSGGRCFASESLVDDKGRRIMWAWAPEARSPRRWASDGWAGVMTLPRCLSLAEDRTLRIEPVPELERLRLNHRQQRHLILPPDEKILLNGIQGNSLELKLEIVMEAAKQVSLKVLATPDGVEETVVMYDAVAGVLSVDVSKSTLDPEVRYGWPKPHQVNMGADDVRVQKAPLILRPGESLQLRLFLDKSILEVFANGRQCVTQRVYPTRVDACRVELMSRGGQANARSVDAWDMAPSNPW